MPLIGWTLSRTRNPPQAYDPHLLARAIARAYVKFVRDVSIGGADGISVVVGNLVAPRVMDWIAARFGHTSMTTKNRGDLAQRYTLYPGLTFADVAGFAVFALAQRPRCRRSPR